MPKVSFNPMTMLDTRVLAEMEGWEGIGQEELSALRHQVSRLQTNHSSELDSLEQNISNSTQVPGKSNLFCKNFVILKFKLNY